MKVASRLNGVSLPRLVTMGTPDEMLSLNAIMTEPGTTAVASRTFYCVPGSVNSVAGPTNLAHSTEHTLPRRENSMAGPGDARPVSGGSHRGPDNRPRLSGDRVPGPSP
jgi:hypothetical protein